MGFFNKKGDEKYYIIISLILGIIVLLISLYFIFQEYFNEDDINWETCRQSVILRSLKIKEGVGEDTIKSKFPFKCKTQVVTIKNEKEALPKIAKTVAECHNLYGGGKYKLYGQDWIVPSTNCFVCARITFGEKYNSKEELHVGDYLINTIFYGNLTYFDYVYGDRPSKVSYEELKKQISGASNFNPSKGDIFVVYYYKKGGTIQAGLNEIFGLSLESGGWYGVVAFYQEDKLNEMLGLCDVVETIPA